jgi:hypothetical protein
MKIITLSGRAKVGKTHAAQLLAKSAYEKGMHPVYHSFAGILKQSVAESAGYDDWKVYKQKYPEKYRSECQRIGAMRRQEDPEYWIKKWIEAIATYRNDENKAIDNKHKHWERVILCDDLRYMNELAAAKQVGAFTVFILSSNRELEGEGEEWRNHESETLANRVDANDKNYDIDLFQSYITNGGSVDEFDNLLSCLVPSWIGAEVGVCLEFVDELAKSLRKGEQQDD